jgi:hypothetical protein
MGEPQPASHRGARDLEIAINEAIEACDGDLRATVRALIVANGFSALGRCSMKLPSRSRAGASDSAGRGR